MNKAELKRQVKDLYEVLNKLIKYSPKTVEFVVKVATVSEKVQSGLENKSNIREIKKRRLTDNFIKDLYPFDIHEALNIEIKDARKKLENFDFTTKEKNIILNTFSGNIKYFLKEYNGGMRN